MKNIKTVSVILLIAVMIISAFPITASADDSVSVSLGAGQSYTLPVDIESGMNIGDPNVISVSDTTVTALRDGSSTLTYTGWDGKLYEYSFTVTPAPSYIKLNCYSKTLRTNNSLYLRYTLSPGADCPVSFSSSDSKTVSVSSSGRVFAKKAGSAVITASAYNGVSAKCVVKSEQEVVRVDLSKNRIVLPKKTKVKLTAKVNNGAVSTKFRWKSSNKKVASVKAKGKSAVVTLKKKGKAKITVKTSNGKTRTCAVRVTSTKTSDSVKKQINSQPLLKQKTGLVELDKLINKIFKKIFKKGYSTYDKIKAIYNYEIKHFDYGIKEITAKQYRKAYSNPNNQINPVYMNNGMEVSNAYRALVTNIGVCGDYSAVFMVMTRAIGLETCCVGGSTTKAGGGWTGHTWNNMIVNGKYIVFDAQVEDNIANGGHISYYRFAKKDKEVKRYYKYVGRARDIKSYNSDGTDYGFAVNVRINSGGKTYNLSREWKQGGSYTGANRVNLITYGEGASYEVTVTKGSGAYYVIGDSRNYSDGKYYINKFQGVTDSYSSGMGIRDAYTGKEIRIN